MIQLAFSVCYLRVMIRREIRADLMKFLVRGCYEDKELLKRQRGTDVWQMRHKCNSKKKGNFLDSVLLQVLAMEVSFLLNSRIPMS